MAFASTITQQDQYNGHNGEDENADQQQELRQGHLALNLPFLARGRRLPFFDPFGVPVFFFAIVQTSVEGLTRSVCGRLTDRRKCRPHTGQGARFRANG